MQASPRQGEIIPFTLGNTAADPMGLLESVPLFLVHDFSFLTGTWTSAMVSFLINVWPALCDFLGAYWRRFLRYPTLFDPTWGNYLCQCLADIQSNPDYNWTPWISILKTEPCSGDTFLLPMLRHCNISSLKVVWSGWASSSCSRPSGSCLYCKWILQLRRPNLQLEEKPRPESIFLRRTFHCFWTLLVLLKKWKNPSSIVFKGLELLSSGTLIMNGNSFLDNSFVNINLSNILCSAWCLRHVGHFLTSHTNTSLFSFLLTV